MSQNPIKNRQVFHAGSNIFHEGEAGHAMYVVEKGRIQIWVGQPEAKTILGVIPTGGVFGEMAIFDDGVRMASASAMEETVLVRIPADRVRGALQKADPILEKLVRIMLTSARSLAKQVEDLSAQVNTLQNDAPRPDAAPPSPATTPNRS